MEETMDTETNSACTRKRSHARSMAEPKQACERFYAAFRTGNPAIPYHEVTVMAASRMDAKKLARAAVAPLGLHECEID